MPYVREWDGMESNGDGPKPTLRDTGHWRLATGDWILNIYIYISFHHWTPKGTYILYILYV